MMRQFFNIILLLVLAVEAGELIYRNNHDTDSWGEAIRKADHFVSQLTLDEKISLVHGNATTQPCLGALPAIPRLNFSGVCMLDGPQAVNRQDLVSVFPSGLTAAASWDRDLLYRRGVALGDEARGKGARVILGPTAGPMGRHALGGRNWEGFGPDPFLSGTAMGATVRGIQHARVQTCSKHYVANEQETQRSNTTSPAGRPIDAISSNVDDRTLHELYIWPFADAIRAGTASVMCSYNRLNQTYACENEHLLDKILRDELGFSGYVVSDWFATESTAKAINAGLDMEMPGFLGGSQYPGASFHFGQKLVDAIKNGSVLESRVDEMARRVITPYFLLNQDDELYPTVDPSSQFVLLTQEQNILDAIDLGLIPPGTEFPPGRDVRGNHSQLIREMGAASTVLLKNNNTLPLRQPKVIGVFGDDAADIMDGSLVQDPSLEGTSEIGSLAIGGGSGTGRLSYTVSPLEAIKNKAREVNATVQHITNNNLLAAGNFKGVYPPPDTCLVFQKTFAVEGDDRVHWELDNNSTAAIRNVAKLCDNVVVVTHSAGVNTLPWADEPKIGAILAAGYPGQESGNSIVDVLWGHTNPSGRLPYTIPFDGRDSGAPIVNLTGPVNQTSWQSDFNDGLFIDYRHYDAKNITPRFEFGFGLSYTTFELEGDSLTVHTVDAISLDPMPNPDQDIEIGGHPELWEQVATVGVAVANRGELAGHAVPQLYVSFPKSTPGGTPLRVLRGFEKTYLEPGASSIVQFPLMRRDVSYWDEKEEMWVIPAGAFTVHVGFSSRDIHHTAELVLVD